ncbi:hypothetical protein [Rhodopseudomonas sp. BR0G17]|uniref:hypothetical protein n=1 Tax=Rhodopseudomonas sp. BR0G17 TaxID=2269368 RepID=UPI0032DEE7FB
MGHGVGVPPLGQHRDRDDAADLFAEPADAADSVHHLTQQFAFADFALGAARPLTVCEFTLELLNLGTGGVAKPLVQRIPGLDLPGVDQKRSWPRQPHAVLVVVAEQFEVPGMERRALALLRIAAFKTGDPLEHQLGNSRVLTDDDEHRRDANPFALPALELAFVMAVQGVQCRAQHVG